VDMEASPMTFKVKGEGDHWTLVATARVQDGEVRVQWMDDWWGGWAELQGDEEYKKLTATAKEKLGKSTGNTAKGRGKGKMGKIGKGGKGGGW